MKEMGAFIDKVGELTDFVLETMDYLTATDKRPDIPKLREPMPQLQKQTSVLPLREGRSRAPAASSDASKA